MVKRTLILAGALAVIMIALLANLYILGWVQFPQLSENLRKILGIIAVSTAAVLVIVALVKLASSRQ